jgi:hypothetical protein
MKKNILFALFFFLNLNLILNFASCSTTDPKLEPDLKLELKDVSCTEAWLQLTTNNIQLPTTINLLKNNSVTQTFSLSTQDSLLYIDSLLPNQNYSFQASSTQSAGGGPVSSNKVTATTLDTTSHNFTWQTFEFGQHSSSVLYDAAIIDENNIWAVGRLYMNDTLNNPDLIYYNAIHWNGQNWGKKKILYQSGIWEIKTIFAVNENDIWFSGYERYYNTNFIELPIPNILIGWGISKMWGKSSNEIYIVGSGGNIARYNGSNWQKLYSGTDFYLADIFGNNNSEIYVIGNRSSLGQGLVLKSSHGVNFSTMIESANISESQIFKPKLFGSLTSVWIDQSNTVYTAGDLFYRYKLNKWDYVKSFPGNHYGGNQNANSYGYFTGIAGNASNDMWVVGERNTVRHFNGVTWQQIGLPYDRMSDIIWLDLEVKGAIVAITGMKGNKAFLMIAKR